MINIKNLLFKISDWFAVPKCIGCGEVIESGLFMCDRCAEIWSGAKTEICRRCGKTCDACACVPELLEPSEYYKLKNPLWLAFYESYDSESERTLSGKIIYKFKRRYNRRLIRFFALEMSAKILTRIREDEIPLSEFVITYAPRSRESVNEYGFDHSKKLSEEISVITGISFVPVIKRKSGTVQKNLDYGGRIKNAASSYTLVKSKADAINGRHIILIDDVMTSGATMSACAKLLLGASASSVLCASILKTKT